MSRKESGFTLIELMIVIAIIGILASIAMPSYVGYVRKANATEAITLTNAMVKKSVLYYNQNGIWPTTAELAAFDSSVSGTNTDYASDVIHSVDWSRNNAGTGTGVFWVRFNNDAFGFNQRRHLRAVMTDQNGVIDVDWCDQNGSWPTEPDIFEYVGC